MLHQWNMKINPEGGNNFLEKFKIPKFIQEGVQN